MADDRIQHKEWLVRLDQIQRNDKIVTAALRLGLRVVGGGKHPYTVRDPDDLDDTGKRNLIAVIPSKLNKRVNKMIFKEILLSPIVQRLNITEDQVWSAFDIS